MNEFQACSGSPAHLHLLEHAFRENGKEVPKDYSIVGFEDLEIIRYNSPKLTTIRQDVFNKRVVSAQTIIDPIELIVRKSHDRFKTRRLFPRTLALRRQNEQPFALT
ncbi:substrate-binding domain-containing protein [Paenibacillus durus]|uniref:substrate-binding domain-containing protein n=1 Tax=Paenibacillus durus TaxID=44251 RepID=UPI0009E2C905|nr:substrate-binding domain-containing protein [Paenibacillus durus]